ncbi:tetratricopeptide repeat protein [Microvirga soli]|uniref:tetratricopeptide repeat protein n=1 Tax=Microvirga soli TaxID=1854496 RepID=UPI00191EC550|nr:tetratricopeptide repeat protein [Microvirga soli]
MTIDYISTIVEPVVWQELFAMARRDLRLFGRGLILGYAAIATVAMPVTSQAVMIDDPTSEFVGNAELLVAEQLVKEQRFEEALPLLQRVLAQDPGNADAYNYLAFSQRKLGRFEEAFANYIRALDLDPDHMGAREYLGELYLQLGQREMAEEQLSRLMVLCPLGCEARDELARAISESKHNQPPEAPGSRP